MPCILTPTNLIGVSRHYTVYPLIVQVNLFCGGGMGLFCERGTSFWRKNSPSRALPPRKPLRVSCPCAQSARRDGALFRGRWGFFCERRTSFWRKNSPSRAPPQESRLGFPVPPRKARAGTDVPSQNRNKAASAAPFGRRIRPGGFLRRGVQGGPFLFLKEGFPPSVTSPKS